MGENRPGSNCSGEQLDANVKFYYLRARWMEPSAGRFVSVDPFCGLLREPVTLHDYQYARLSAASVSDPSGQFFGLPSLIIGSRGALQWRAQHEKRMYWGTYRPMLIKVGAIATAMSAAREIIEIPGTRPRYLDPADYANPGFLDCTAYYLGGRANCNSLVGTERVACEAKWLAFLIVCHASNISKALKGLGF